MNELEKAIRAEIARYIDGEQDADTFFRWFFAETWELPEGAPLALCELTARIGVAHAEWSSGHLSADEATELLAKLASTVDVGPRSAVQFRSSGRAFEHREVIRQSSHPAGFVLPQSIAR
jgi:hypothetical protein